MSTITPYELVTAALEAKGYKLRTVKPHTAGIARGVRSNCPACEGHSKPLEVAERNDGAVLLYCHAQCSVYDVAAALGLEIGDLFPTRDPARERIAGTQGPIHHWTSVAADVDAALELAAHGGPGALAAVNAVLVRLRANAKAAFEADAALRRQLAKKKASGVTP